MHKLGRCVRFSVNPFLDKDGVGFNSFCSKPTGEGLAVFLELTVELVGKAEPTTGFVVNVTDIDDCVRSNIVPVFTRHITDAFGAGCHIGILRLVEILRFTQKALDNKFAEAKLAGLSLKLNPLRKIAIDCEDDKMAYFSEKFEFAATHKLWNDDFSQQKNRQVFGKCANPTGHGHNYIIEVTVKVPDGKRDFCISDFERVVDENLIKILDHKNLNIDVDYFAETNPTVENIAAFAFDKLAGKFTGPALHCVTVWENEKTYCSYYANAE